MISYQLTLRPAHTANERSSRVSLERGYAVITSLDPVEEGKLYHHPVHMKLLPWFTIESEQESLIETLQESVESVEPFTIVGGPEVGLSTTGDHRARIVGERAFIAAIHNQLLDDTLSAGAVFDKPEYTGDNFMPHVTPQTNGIRWIRNGQAVDIDELQLVAAVANSPMSGVVIKRFHLGDTAS